ncbi:MAG: glycosyltransferase [Actinomycetota bacterium]|nr:glycosyltransferase [Actinomycetota bacterium]
MDYNQRLIDVDDYKQFVDKKTIDRIKEKAKPLQGAHVAHVNSTFYGGGVAEILSPLTLLMNTVGIKAEWKVIQGSPDFFSITKKMHNALQGAEIHLTELKKEIYERVLFENSVRNRMDHNFIVVHDPQPLGMIKFYEKRQPWIWRCHIDLSSPDRKLFSYLSEYIQHYDTAILTLKEYRQNIKPPQVFFMPAIDPFCVKNKKLNEKEIEDRFQHYNIPTDLPLVVQISRFDKWKDPEGVIEAFNIARKKVDCNLVLLGNIATDDPEGEEIYQNLLKHQDDHIKILSHQDSALVNALQTKAAVVLQKSLKEGFGLTVTEAMWKGTAVIGGRTGGIVHQIEDGVNGFLVSSVEQAAQRIVQLVQDEQLRKDMGTKARETVRSRFLLIRYLEQYLDLFNSFETIYRFNKHKYSKGTAG